MPENSRQWCPVDLREKMSCGYLPRRGGSYYGNILLWKRRGGSKMQDVSLKQIKVVQPLADTVYCGVLCSTVPISVSASVQICAISQQFIISLISPSRLHYVLHMNHLMAWNRFSIRKDSKHTKTLQAYFKLAGVSQRKLNLVLGTRTPSLGFQQLG